MNNNRNRPIIIISIMVICLPLNIISQNGWFAQQSNATSHLYASSFINVNTGIVVGDNGIKLKTTNGGNNWIKLDSVFSIGLRSIQMIDASTGFTGGSDGVLYKTSNGGLNWVSIYNAQLSIHGIFYKSGILSVVTRDFCHRSTNMGTTFNSHGLSTNGGRSFFVDQNYGYTANSWSISMTTFLNVVQRTTNGGLNWSITYSRTDGAPIFSSIHFINQSTGYIAGYWGVLKSTDYGVSWSFINTTVGLWRVYFFDENTGFFTRNREIFKTTNGGVNSVSYNTGGNGSHSDINFVNTQTGWIVGSDGSIFKTTDGGIVGISELITEIPKSFTLSQNYPNPFNPVTNIKFDLPKPGFVRMIVYDLLGREITQLVNQQMHAGSYSADWDASAYPSGVYFYKIETGDFVKTRKMVLVK